MDSLDHEKLWDFVPVAKVGDELQAGERACAMLGGKAEGLVRLPIEGREHYVHSTVKTAPTARRYPRKSGTPSKDPLGLPAKNEEKSKYF